MVGVYKSERGCACQLFPLVLSFVAVVGCTLLIGIQMYTFTMAVNNFHIQLCLLQLFCEVQQYPSGVLQTRTSLTGEQVYQKALGNNDRPSHSTQYTLLPGMQW